ncbi:MAG: hypothetical protein KIT14_12490 [bacterium]|nr:hypothetical protein [bacterium]
MSPARVLALALCLAAFAGGMPTRAHADAGGGDPLDCSDGNPCNGTEVYDAATAACIDGPERPCLTGGRSPTAACVGEWYVDAPLPSELLKTIGVTCDEGDPRCDHDADPTTCTFHVAICVAVADPRLPACVAAPVAAYALPRSTLRKAPLAALALLSALAALPGARVVGPYGNDVRFEPVIATANCTALAALPVPAGKRLALKGKLTTAGGRPDRDRLKLACR